MVVLCRQLNSVLFKPLTGVVVVERVEKPFHQFVAPWIDALQVVDAEERVGEVASASARHANLGQHTAALLEDGHRVGGWRSFDWMAAKNPAAPPPMMATCFLSDIYIIRSLFRWRS